MQNKLEANQLDLDSTLIPQMFINDTAGAYEVCGPENEGFLKRRRFFGNDIPVPADEENDKPASSFFQFNDAERTLIGVLPLPLPDVNFLPHVSGVLQGSSLSCILFNLTLKSGMQQGSAL